jgi:glycosyltransferase involved in cell wall biosynthesis
MDNQQKLEFSVIIPVYNEEENILILYNEIKQVLGKFQSYEIIFINDGSHDNSYEVIKKIAVADKSVKIINFARNFGQTAAISAGIHFSRGDIIIPLDADLQNDPRDIPRLIQEIEKGNDVVSGWRKEREDMLINRKIPSWVANWLISFITKVKLHDYGCTLKAYKREVVENIRLYGEMHRFIPAYTAWYGARVKEITVNHRPRRFGKTKYNISRTLKVVLDLLVVKFLSKYLDKPIHFFGKIGFWMLIMGFLSGCYALYLKYFQSTSFISTPVPLLSVVFVIIGIQFILMGLLAEIITRIYFETGKNSTYLIKEKINFD